VIVSKQQIAADDKPGACIASNAGLRLAFGPVMHGAPGSSLPHPGDLWSPLLAKRGRYELRRFL
jgi:hypothetical protein